MNSETSKLYNNSVRTAASQSESVILMCSNLYLVGWTFLHFCVHAVKKTEVEKKLQKQGRRETAFVPADEGQVIN